MNASFIFLKGGTGGGPAETYTGKGASGISPSPSREKKIKLPWAWDKHNLLDIEIISVNKLKMCYSFFDYLTLFYCTIIMLQVGTIPYSEGCRAIILL